ncbi:FIMAH domain-containing protein [Micromonospora sp. MS34]|uniref:FIMAH domain-containing protein n=1 Tax=Micromonospora sp. MS34 TaxID=3385971 RepID=UPI0039A03BC5
MSSPRDLPGADVAPPTTVLPAVRPGGSRHRAPDDGHRLMWLAVAGAAVVVLVAGLTVALGGGDDAPRAPVAVDSGTPGDLEPPAEPSVPDGAWPTPTPTPTSPPPASARAADPARLLAALQGSVDGLVRQGRLRRNDGQDLRKRLREVERLLGAGDIERARARLRDFTARLADLRRQDRLAGQGYDALVAATTELVRALPGR